MNRKLLPFLCLIFVSCTAQSVAPRTEQVLGTVCTVNAYSDGTSSLYDELFMRLEQIDALFNVNLTDSDVSRINAAAGDAEPVTVHDDVLYVLGRALYFAEVSGGMFDPTVGPLVRLWGINTDHAQVPEAQELKAALALVDYRDVELGAHTVRLARQGMCIDLGGIAKGFAADELVKILRKHHVRQAVISLGGNVYVWGKKRNGEAWRVGIKNPVQPEAEPYLMVSIDGSGSVVTSGVYERYFEQDGVRYHHILDVTDGFPARRGHLSTSIVTSCSLDADALSTIAYLLGPEQYFGMQGHEPAVFIHEDGSVTASRVLEGKLFPYGTEKAVTVRFR